MTAAEIVASIYGPPRLAADTSARPVDAATVLRAARGSVALAVFQGYHRR